MCKKTFCVNFLICKLSNVFNDDKATLGMPLLLKLLTDA